MSMLPLPLVHAGKVRDVYDAGEGRLLLVASDRLSAFDVVLPEPVPDKGRVLTAMTAFWFEHLSDQPSHLLSLDPAAVGVTLPDEVAGRMMLVRRCDMLPVECIVRAHLTGSAWASYRETGTVHGQVLPAGLREADRLPAPVFTPTTKAAAGSHDEPISFDDLVATVGGRRAEEARDIALDVFRRGAAHAESRGILLADTKLELGVPGPSGALGDHDARLVLADEVLTPDSSRFWAVEDWQPGHTPVGFDKQPVRDWLDALGWDRRPPAPHIPSTVIAATRERYITIYERLSGRSFATWAGTTRGASG